MFVGRSMGMISAKIYDWVMSAPEHACLAEWRRELLANATGRVLEIGAGTGANVALYPTGIDLVLTEPDAGMRTQLSHKYPEVQVDGASAENLPFANASFDTVVVTLVLCSVPDPGAVLAELHRVLKPEGKLLFMEHVVSQNPERRKSQDRWDPLWSRLAGGCHCNRDTEKNLQLAGFELRTVERASMRKAISIVRPTVRGVAYPR